MIAMNNNNYNVINNKNNFNSMNDNNFLSTTLQLEECLIFYKNYQYYSLQSFIYFQFINMNFIINCCYFNDNNIINKYKNDYIIILINL